MLELEGDITNVADLEGEKTSDILNYNDFTHKPSINDVELVGNKTTEELGINIPSKTSELDNDSGFVTSDALPTKTSDLENDSGFITSADIPPIPSKTSDLQNDSGFITSSALPTKTSDLTNDSGYITSADVPTKTSELTNDSDFVTSADIPTKTSQLTNDSNFATTSQIPTKTSDLTNDSNFATTSDIPTKTSELDNDSGFITGDNYYNKSEIDTALSGKADKSDTYTKTETDNKIVGLIDDNSTANNKAWSASKISGELSGKASTGDLALKADKSDTYTKSETDNKIVGLIDDTTTANNKAWSSSKITDEIINILPTGTESGAVASFKTSLALPLVSIDVDNSATKVYQRGTNLWNEVWETGDYDNQGNKRVYTTRIRCKDKIPVSPSVVYRFYMETSSGIAWQFYDEDGTFISQQSRAAGQGGFDITTPDNCHFLTFGTWDAYGGTYRNDISVNCPHTNTNAYYPYNPLSAEYSIDELDNIVTFEGINNIFADSGNVDVVYKKSINDAIAELQALIL